MIICFAANRLEEGVGLRFDEESASRGQVMEQLVRIHVERACKSKDDEESWFLFAGLESRHVVLMQAAGFCEFFLGPAAGFS